MSKKSQSVKINNRKAAHSQHPESLKTKRQGSGKYGWGDPMDDLKYLNQDSQRTTNPNDPNYEDTEQNLNDIEQNMQDIEQQESVETQFTEDYFQNFQSDVEVKIITRDHHLFNQQMIIYSEFISI